MKYLKIIKFASIVILFTISNELSAQFIDDFQSELIIDQSAKVGWAFRTGDGEAEINFSKKIGKSSAQIEIDATKDVNNIWWAIIRRNISEQIDIKQLTQEGYELRVEAKVKPSHAPRRINLHFNTQRTTDFHSHLMEFDLSDTTNWHVISMTTSGFDAQMDDEVFVQLALMDWGIKKYSLLIKYIRVDVLNKDSIKFDLGNPQMYHPSPPDVSSYKHQITPVQDGIISNKYPNINFSNWESTESKEHESILVVDGTKISLLRWDLSDYSSSKVVGTSLLKLSTKSVMHLKEKLKDFGLVRVCEIIGGDSNWQRNSVTFNSLLGILPIESVINEQMIIDVEVNPNESENTLITIPEAVMNRLLIGDTLGLAILPLGAISVSFYSVFSNEIESQPTLYFNLEK